VAAFLHVDLENIPEVVHGRARSAEHALLFDGSGFGVSLGDDDATQGGTVFAGTSCQAGWPL